jgi:hypothetical protein
VVKSGIVNSETNRRRKGQSTRLNIRRADAI